MMMMMMRRRRRRRRITTTTMVMMIMIMMMMMMMMVVMVIMVRMMMRRRMMMTTTMVMMMMMGRRRRRMMMMPIFNAVHIYQSGNQKQAARQKRASYFKDPRNRPATGFGWTVRPRRMPSWGCCLRRRSSVRRCRPAVDDEKDCMTFYVRKSLSKRNIVCIGPLSTVGPQGYRSPSLSETRAS